MSNRLVRAAVWAIFAHVMTMPGVGLPISWAQEAAEENAAESPTAEGQTPDSTPAPAAEEPAAANDAAEPAATHESADPAAPTNDPAAPAVTTETAAPAATSDPAAPAAAATETVDPAATGAAGPAAAQYQQLFQQFKEVLKQVREIGNEYSIAEDKDLADLRSKWNAKIDEGNQLMPELRAAALAAYLESPESDRELARLLQQMVADDVKKDRYDSAKELARQLMEAGSNDPELKNVLGIAAFASNDFDLADKYLKEAERDGSLSQQGQNFLSSLDQEKELWKNELALREAEAKADDLPRVKLETTAGDIVVELFENEAPETVGNFISLVEKGFYDDLVFHRVLTGFMAQAGCPKGDGTGGPGYAIYCECEKENHRNHFAGSLSMAKEAAKNTGGSQFYITFVPTSHLDGKHTVFGRVIEGMDVLPKLQRVDPENPGEAKERTKIVKATVLRKRDHEYQPNKVK